MQKGRIANKYLPAGCQAKRAGDHWRAQAGAQGHAGPCVQCAAAARAAGPAPRMQAYVWPGWGGSA
eukprot:8118452-Pyramimonas_sp.AAC.1